MHIGEHGDYSEDVYALTGQEVFIKAKKEGFKVNSGYYASATFGYDLGWQGVYMLSKLRYLQRWSAEDYWIDAALKPVGDFHLILDQSIQIDRFAELFMGAGVRYKNLSLELSGEVYAFGQKTVVRKLEGLLVHQWTGNGHDYFTFAPELKLVYHLKSWLVHTVLSYSHHLLLGVSYTYAP
jgi:hypothetical protein